MNAINGIITQPSQYSVTETIDRLEAILKAKNITIFARIDQQAEAEKVGLSLRPTQLLLFGNPKAGTPKVTIGRQDRFHQTFHARYLIAASGIIDYLPNLDHMRNVFDYAGYNLHVCLICDGYEMADKKVGVFASTASNAEVVFPLGWFTPHITLFTQGMFEVGYELRQKLQDNGYQIIETPIQQFLGEDHQMNGVELEDGTVIGLEAGLISMGSKYHADYLEKFDLEKQGENLVTDKMARTSHPRIFAIGDLKVGLNQVVVAAADGALAATQIWRDLRRSRPMAGSGSQMLSGR
ncbi:MAG: FAD-dependent oxidoreductase [Microcoleus sp.]